MASMIDQPMAVGPLCDAHGALDGVADPTLLPNPLGNFFDDAFLSKFSNTPQAPGYTLQDNLDPNVVSDDSSDFTRRDSLLPKTSARAGWEADDDGLHAASHDIQSQQRTSESSEGSEATGRRGSSRKSTKQRRQVADSASARARREVNLEKNRMAANRCRQKRKDWTNKLEDKHRQLSAHNTLLRAEVASLNNAVFALKEMALRHADCGFRPIDKYVRLEAERVRAKARGSV